VQSGGDRDCGKRQSLAGETDLDTAPELFPNPARDSKDAFHLCSPTPPRLRGFVELEFEPSRRPSPRLGFATREAAGAARRPWLPCAWLHPLQEPTETNTLLRAYGTAPATMAHRQAYPVVYLTQ